MHCPKTLSVLPGCADHEHAAWLIGPVGHHRDSELIDESNWHVTCQRFSRIDPEGRDHKVHRFGHWAVGWVEELAYRPGSAVARAADEIRAALDGYSILDEMHLETLELDAEDENRHWILRDVRTSAAKHGRAIERQLERMDDRALGELMHRHMIEGESDGKGWRQYSKREIARLVESLRGARRARRRARRARKTRRGYA